MDATRRHGQSKTITCFRILRGSSCNELNVGYHKHILALYLHIVICVAPRLAKTICRCLDSIQDGSRVVQRWLTETDIDRDSKLVKTT